MKFAGLTDSLAAATSPPQKCRVCGSSSRIAYGLCLGCLLHDTVINEDAEGTGFAAALQDIEVADTATRFELRCLHRHDFRDFTVAGFTLVPVCKETAGR